MLARAGLSVSCSVLVGFCCDFGPCMLVAPLFGVMHARFADSRLPDCSILYESQFVFPLVLCSRCVSS